MKVAIIFRSAANQGRKVIGIPLPIKTVYEKWSLSPTQNSANKKIRLKQVIIKPSENEVQQDYIQMLENSNNF